jgi:tripartite ATP-independent transporter DctM subunit
MRPEETDMEATVAAVMFTSFFVLVFLGVPIAFSIGISTILSMLLMFPAGTAVAIVAQRSAAGLDNFALLAIPFFILAGTLMNHGGIAIRLINLAKVLVGWMPGSLLHVNVLANMMFGAISGSATAAAAAVGGTLFPIQKKEGYDDSFTAAVNISSCVTGLLIPPSNVMIVYSLTAGGLSVAALFMAGYLPGIIMGIAIMGVVSIIAKKHKYPTSPRVTPMEAFKAFLDAIPSLLLIVIVIGGIMFGAFTATEGSGIAVVYTFFLSVICYRSIPLRKVPPLILEATVMTCVVLLLVAVSVGMSWAMTNADIPFVVSEWILDLTHEPYIILIIINVILLIVGVFMDMTPAVLIFTPIFLPIVQDIGITTLHFGIIMIYNLCIGLCTPPVGTALFVGCSISGVKIQNAIRPLLPLFGAQLAGLILVTYIPWISMVLPRYFGLI